MYLYRRMLHMAVLVGAIFIFPLFAEACTLWAGAGDSIVDGGTIISKNRDWLPDNQQQLRLIKNAGGYRFVSLYASGNNSSGTKAGINEKGFAIVTASPPSYLETPENYKGKTTTPMLLTRYDSVASALSALQAGEWSRGPEYLVLSDPKEVACVEFGNNSTYDIVSRTNSGVTFHTNHYLAQELMALNQGNLANSQKRYTKIQGFLQTKPQYDIADFRAYSDDPTLWRIGRTPASVCTLASFMIRQFSDGQGTLYLKMANPGKTVKEYEFSLADLFAGRVDLSQVE